jgi:hypothetical protein
LEYSHYGKILDDGSVIESPMANIESLNIKIVTIPISIHNPSSYPINTENINIGISGPWVSGLTLDIVKDHIQKFGGGIAINDGTNIVPVGAMNSIAYFKLPKLLFPDAWHMLSCNFGIYYGEEKEISCSIKQYSEIGTQELKFVLKLGISVELERDK